MGLPTPNTPPTLTYKCWRLLLPEELPQLRAAIIGAIAGLVRGNAWVEEGTMTEEDTRQVVFKALLNLEECQQVYPGEIRAFYTGAIPDRWIKCDGRTVQEADYPELAAAIHPSAKAGTTLQIPDLRQRVIVGDDPGNTDYDFGSSGGAETHTLTIDQIPPHTHNYNTPNYQAVSVEIGPIPIAVANGAIPTPTTGAGQGWAHNNMQPYHTMMFCMYGGSL